MLEVSSKISDLKKKKKKINACKRGLIPPAFNEKKKHLKKKN